MDEIRIKKTVPCCCLLLYRDVLFWSFVGLIGCKQTSSKIVDPLDNQDKVLLCLSSSFYKHLDTISFAGKTTLADTLVASNGIISQRMAGKVICTHDTVAPPLSDSIDG